MKINKIKKQGNGGVKKLSKESIALQKSVEMLPRNIELSLEFIKAHPIVLKERH